MLAPPAHAAAASFAIRLGRAAAVPVALPLLAGLPEENLFPDAEPQGTCGNFSLHRAGSWLLGHGSVAVTTDFETTTRQLYAELLTATRGRHLCRIWNYVPAINGIGRDGLEHYRAFSRGRSLAFEAAMGPEFKSWLPAASAVGSGGDQLTVVFAAHSSSEPLHRENPRQIPAYEYPSEHGPRAPSFARASVVPQPSGQRDVFISGTSAIEGHATVAPGDTLAQTRCTVKNLRAIGQSCGLGADLAGGRCARRHLKIYLRAAHDHVLVARELQETLLHADDEVTFLVADICRAALNVEIEMTLFGVAS